jgi:hypothetical protein
MPFCLDSGRFRLFQLYHGLNAGTSKKIAAIAGGEMAVIPSQKRDGDAIAMIGCTQLCQAPVCYPEGFDMMHVKFGWRVHLGYAVMLQP